MTITRDAWIRYFYTVVISTLIHIICHLTTDGRLEFFSLLNSIMLGVNIWFLAEALFSLANKIWPRSATPGYIVLLFVIGIGTFLGAYALGVREMYLMVIICIIAETAGFLLIFINRNKYKKELNKKLEAFKKEA